jgi:acetoin utilization deacetylase AcuC-like enzyme
MYFVYDPHYTMHKTGAWHPEQPNRVAVINQALQTAGLKTVANTLKPRKATEAEILLCHTKSYYELVQKEINALQNYSGTTTLSTGDVEVCHDSFDIALLAAGGALTAVDKIMTSSANCAFCITRPPGHHATSDKGMGFCIFNNIAIAARYAQQKYGIKRVLIADWDVHHGNGTQDIFYEDPSVFYFSTHEKDLYPFTGTVEDTGEGLGKGTTLNIPIKPTLLSRSEVIQAFQSTLKERMQAFKPELVLISAGFDGHESDPLGHFNLKDEDFFTLTTCLKEIANEYSKGKIVSILEGGYNLTALAPAAVSHVKALGK